jgi:nitrogen-specific signal transduction histidine kinase
MKKQRAKHTAPVPPTPESPQSVVSLASGMADDFNNILTTVMGACSLIDREDSANAELLRFIALIRSSAERAADLSDKLVKASTLEQITAVSITNRQISDSAATSARDKKTTGVIVSSKNRSGSTPP